MLLINPRTTKRDRFRLHFPKRINADSQLRLREISCFSGKIFLFFFEKKLCCFFLCQHRAQNHKTSNAADVMKERKYSQRCNKHLQTFFFRSPVFCNFEMLFFSLRLFSTQYTHRRKHSFLLKKMKIKKLFSKREWGVKHSVSMVFCLHVDVFVVLNINFFPTISRNSSANDFLETEIIFNAYSLIK